jgi:aminopeptidase N
VKAAAIAKLGTYKSAKYASIFRAAVNDSSYTVSGNALEALSLVDSAGAIAEAKRLSAMPSKGKLANVIKKLSAGSDLVAGTKLLADFEAMPLGQNKFAALEGVFELIASTNSIDLLKRAVDDVIQLEKDIPEAFRAEATNQLNAGLREIQAKKAADGMKDQADYIESKLPKDDKKGF